MEFTWLDKLSLVVCIGVGVGLSVWMVGVLLEVYSLVTLIFS